jgi:hypothetical protein
VATALDKDKLHDVLDQAVIVIDEQDLERSRKDPRVRALVEGPGRSRSANASNRARACMA